jgi:hypothetical protein
MTIAEMSRKVNSLNLHKEVVQIIALTDKEIIKANQDQLYFKGEDSKGKRLTGYYFDCYRKYKEGMNSGTGVTDLKDTGDFYSGFFVDTGSESFAIDSTDGKTRELVDKYGADIFGLQNETRSRYTIEVFWPRLKTRIETVTGLTLN